MSRATSNAFFLSRDFLANGDARRTRKSRRDEIFRAITVSSRTRGARAFSCGARLSTEVDGRFRSKNPSSQFAKKVARQRIAAPARTPAILPDRLVAHLRLGRGRRRPAAALLHTVRIETPAARIVECIGQIHGPPNARRVQRCDLPLLALIVAFNNQHVLNLGVRKFSFEVPENHLSIQLRCATAQSKKEQEAGRSRTKP